MDILGVGTHIVECPRIARMIADHGELFLRRVYTDREIRDCQARRHAMEHFSGRWAAKEAILRALGTSWSQGIHGTDLEVRYDPDGRARVLVRGAAKDAAIGRGVRDIHLSIAHCRTYATAYALVVGTHRPTEPDPSDPEADTHT